MKDSHEKCIGTAIALLLIFLAGTMWIGYGAPSVIKAYGLPPEVFQFNWLIVPIVFAILGSIAVAARTPVLPERRKCYWIVSMVLLFPFSTAALIARIMWHRR